MTETLPTGTSLRLKRADLVCLGVLFILAVVILSPILFMPFDRAPGLPGHDGETQWLPWRTYAAESVTNGTLPLWNPYILCGTPFVGNFQSALFYPPNAIYLVCPVGMAARLSILFHLWLSLFFAYLLARAFGCDWPGCAVTAMTFAFCAPQLLRVPAGHWGVACAIPWIALVFLCVELVLRKPTVKPMLFGAAAIAMQVLSGVPQYVFVTAVAVGCYVLLRAIRDGISWRGRMVRWAFVAGIFLGGALLSSIQFLPGIEAAQHGARSLAMRREWIELFSWAPENALTSILPGFFGGAGNAPYWGRFFFWEMNAYVGIASLAFAIMALIAVRRRAVTLRLATLVFLMMLLALGKHFPLQRVLLAVLPMSGMFRGSAKFLLPGALALSMLAGLGVQEVLSDGRTAWRKAQWPLAVLAVLVGGLLLLGVSGSGFLTTLKSVLAASREVFGSTGSLNLTEFFRKIEMLDGIIALLLIAAAASVLIYWQSRPDRVSASVIGAFIFILVALDFMHYGGLFITSKASFSTDATPWRNAASWIRREDSLDHRMLALGAHALNAPMTEGTFAIEGIEPNPPLRFHELFMHAQGMPTDVAPSIYQLRGLSRVTQLGALGWIVAPTDMTLSLPDAQLANEYDGWNVYELAGAMPRTAVVYKQVTVDSRKALESTLAIDPTQLVVFEDGFSNDDFSRMDLNTESHVVETSPNTVVVEASLERSGYLVLFDNWYPGWEASVGTGNDRMRLRVFRADYAFRAVRLPAGQHRIRFQYRPTSFRIGLWLSVLAWLLWIAGMVRMKLVSMKTLPSKTE